MALVRFLIIYGYAPLFFVGFVGSAVAVVAAEGRIGFSR